MRSANYIGLSMYEECSVIISHGGSGEKVCEYHGLFWSKSSDADGGAGNAYHLGYATSYSPFGRFYGHRQSPWSIRSYFVPTVTILSKKEIYIVYGEQTTQIFVCKMHSINTTSSNSTVLLSFPSSPAITGQPNKWDETITQGSLTIGRNNEYIVVYVGSSKDGRTSLGIATSTSYSMIFQRPSTTRLLRKRKDSSDTSEQEEVEGDGKEYSNTEEALENGQILVENANVTTFHDPFMYVDEKGSYHVLFMGSFVKEEIKEEDSIVKEILEDEKRVNEEEEQGNNEKRKNIEHDKEHKCTTAVYHITSPALNGPWSIPTEPSLECGQYHGTNYHSFLRHGMKRDDDAPKDVVEHLTKIQRPRILFSNSLSAAVGFYVSATLESPSSSSVNNQRNAILGASTAHTNDDLF
jgi:hypothetical protein